MPALDAQRLFAALVLLVIALFLIAGRAPGRYGPLLRRVAVAAYAVAVGLALVQVWRWLIG